MAKVKGTMLVEFVKAIRADKSGAYDKLLNDEAREVVSKQVLASAWYPFEVYRDCFNAVVKVVAGGDMETVRNWGLMYGEKIVSEVYRNLVIEGDPAAAAKKYKVVIKNFFDFGDFDVELASKTEGLIRIHGFDPKFEPFYHMARGWVEKSLEMSGAKDIKSEFVSRSWKGDPETSIRFKWNL